jgi:hypothetical protein
MLLGKFEGSYSSLNCKKSVGGMVEEEKTSYLDYKAIIRAENKESQGKYGNKVCKVLYSGS